MKHIVINDLHIGVQRTGGTTAESAAALRQFALDRYSKLLELGDRFIVNGDMFDNHIIPLSDLLQAYQITADWLTAAPGRQIDLIPGNHCLSKNSANLSSFELMARLLQARFPDNVRYLAGANWIAEKQGLFAISHMPNQDLFDLELGRIPDNVKVLFLHCNYDNEFAGQSDHSLNLSRDTAKELTRRGITLVLGHEHQGRTMMNDKVILVGNQFPTSVSDCLAHGDAGKDGTKYCLSIDGEDMELIPVWNRNDPGCGYIELEWDNLPKADTLTQKFIRISGDANSSQAGEAIKAISKFRQASDAYVVTNAVRVDGATGTDEIADSVEDIRSINVIEMLLEMLDKPQADCVRKLLSEAN